MAFKFTELVTFPTIYQWLEIHGFFIYLLLVSDIYLVYLLWYVLRGSNPTNESKKIKVIGNLKVNNIAFRDLVTRDYIEISNCCGLPSNQVPWNVIFFRVTEA